MKSRTNEFPNWLSEVTEQIFRTEYPSLASLKSQDGWHDKIKFIPKSFWFVMAIFVLFVTLNEFFIGQGIVLSTYNLDSQRAADILASSLEYLAGLVGIVLPIILIIVEFVSKDKGTSSLVDIYLEETNLKRTAIWALIFLATEAIFMAIFRAEINFIARPEWLLYLIFLFTLLNIAVIYETGKTIWDLRRSLSDRFLVETLITTLTSKIRLSQKAEVLYRLSHINSLKFYEQFGLDKSPYGYQPQNTFPIYSTSSGIIEDVHLNNLNEFAQLIKASSEKAFISKSAYDSIQENEAIAYIPSNLGGNGAELSLQEALNKSFKIRKDAKSSSNVNDSIKTLLEQVKYTTETAIRDENKIFFDDLMSVYQQIFILGVGLPIPPSTFWLNDFVFRGWSANQIAIRHMEDFIEVAARSRSREFIDSLSGDIFRISSSMIQNSNVVVDSNLSQVLGLYVTMYIFSHEFDNKLGKSRSYFYLTRYIVDHIWSSSLEKSFKDLQVVNNHYEIFRNILGSLTRILKEALVLDDLDTFKDLLKFMHPSELLANFYLDQTCHREYYQLSKELEEVPENEKKIVEEQIEALRLVEGIQANTQKFFNQFVILAASYTCELFEQDKISFVQFEKRLAPLEPYFLPVEQTIEICSDLVKDDNLRGWGVFSLHPDTKRTYSPNDEGKIFLFCCLRGMSLLKNTEIHTTLSLNLEHQLQRIKETSDRLVENSSRWSRTSFFLGLDDDYSEVENRWLTLIDDINLRWQEGRKNQIRDSELDPKKLEVFSEAVENAIELASKNSYRELLKSYGKITPFTNSNKQIQNWRIGEKEYFTPLYEDIGYAKALGEMYGNSIVRGGDNQLIHFWIQESRNLPTRKDWKNFQPYFDCAVNKFNGLEFKVSCFFVSESRNLFRWLQSTPGFVEHYRLDIPEKLPMLKGFYNNIPVFSYFPQNDTEQYILVLDLEKAVQLIIGDINTEIRTLTEEEIRQKIINDTSKSREESLLLISVRVNQLFDIELLDRNAIARMKLKLPIVERSIFESAS